ncbi:acyl-CoA thioesterase/BAAT N-terminal domain-containing protein [Inhella proteolytica]|uniref:Acyl-CoA thioesterase/BAAT N-terminal domain-containing protein n=1 Tax=Inhella proteolytica TaxID=2795029 RepID=A0A931IZJ4_9BURK|nr:acyl-CoA thioester hydrolase/BAAT C-terminal domain-containing protein [Inhella proteolytica]MBH9576696.1 acyl-CoA thioesterase/BAAT N-terminal domain-containing protein [Inhella proteolytica]
MNVLRRALFAAGLLALSVPVCAQRIDTNTHQPVLAGEPLQLALADLQPGQTVTLRAERTVRTFSGPVRRFMSEARFQADAQGRVDLTAQAPLPGGSYAGADVRGLLWSMRMQDGEVKEPVFNRIQFQLHDAEGKPLAQAELRLTQALPDVQTRKPAGFPGALFAHRAGAAKRPALILLGGSEGGSAINRDAPFWASQGYAVLALPYYSPRSWSPSGMQPPELPELPANFVDIPIERLEQARAWLAEQPEVDATRIGVQGTSKGAEFALIAGTRLPWIKGIAAIVPSDVVWEGWGEGVEPGKRSSFAWQGQALDFVPYKDFQQEFAGAALGEPIVIRRPLDKGRAAATPAQIEKARIPVERIAAPVFLLGGDDDQVWDSGRMAQALADRRAQVPGLKTMLLRHAEAGHFLGGTGTGPTTHYNDGLMKNGGTPAANARAQAEGHAALKAFWAATLN